MPLPNSSSSRTLKHSRNIQVEVYYRDDGLWDIDARLTDTKTHDIKLTAGVLAANQPIHDLRLRLTVDNDANVRNVEAISSSVPFPGFCDTHGDAYKRLIGLNLLSGFRQGVRERLPDTDACTHLNELATILPTVAMQGLTYNDVRQRTDIGQSNQDKKPFELDRCHALRSDGPAVARYYPRWAFKPEK